MVMSVWHSPVATIRTSTSSSRGSSSSTSVRVNGSPLASTIATFVRMAANLERVLVACHGSGVAVSRGCRQAGSRPGDGRTLMTRHRAMPSLVDAHWLDTTALTPEYLSGQVVLVDFWTLTCINWLRTEPHVRAWALAYRGDGLVVIGVHTPEFSFEHETDRIRLAVEERSIDYPVVVDNDYGVWTAFDNHYWPALYFVDDAGVIRDQHFGEGRYEESERVIQGLLGVQRPLVQVHATGVEAPAAWEQLRTPETYLGYARGDRFVSPGEIESDRPGTFALPAELGPNQWALAGE